MAYKFRSSAQYHDHGKHGGVQEDMALKKEPRGLKLDLQTVGKERAIGPDLGFLNSKIHPQ